MAAQHSDGHKKLHYTSPRHILMQSVVRSNLNLHTIIMWNCRPLRRWAVFAELCSPEWRWHSDVSTSYCFTKLPAWLHPRHCSGCWCPEPEPELSQRFHLVKGNVSVRAGDTHPTPPRPGYGEGGDGLAWVKLSRGRTQPHWLFTFHCFKIKQNRRNIFR